MTRRRDIEKRLRSFGDIHKILGSMRNLSYLEIRKLTQFLASQRRVVESIHRAAGDFLRFYPDLLGEPPRAEHLFVLIGSERGFCGDFNELLLRAAEVHPPGGGALHPRLIPVGRKLCAMLDGDPRVLISLDGPSVAEEVDRILLSLIAALNDYEREHGPLALQALYHDADRETVRAVYVLPPFQDAPQGPADGYPPGLTLSPEGFLVELVDQYLFAALYQLFYSSLMAEQQFRIRHLEGAMRRMEEKMDALALTRNTLRQEEIIEEIEVILMGAGAPA